MSRRLGWLWGKKKCHAVKGNLSWISCRRGTAVAGGQSKQCTCVIGERTQAPWPHVNIGFTVSHRASLKAFHGDGFVLVLERKKLRPSESQ